jgi:hypothetical protein
MSSADAQASWFKRLFWPDLRAASSSDREIATERIQRAHADGLITEEELRERQDQVPPAQTRAELRPAIKDLPGTTSPGLLATRQAVTAVWLGVNFIQIVVWVLICVIGLHFANPWWLWSLVGGLIIVGPLWWFADAEFRTTDTAANGSNGEGRSTK